MRPEAVVRAHVDAFNSGDLNALLACFTHDATWVTGASSFRGARELATLFERAFADLRPQLTIERLVADGDDVACQLREEYTTYDGPHLDHIGGFYRIEAGRIASAKIYREGSADV